MNGSASAQMLRKALRIPLGVACFLLFAAVAEAVTEACTTPAVCAVADATSVTAYRIGNFAVLRDLRDLQDLGQAVAASDRAEIDATSAARLKAFVLDRDRRTYMHREPGRPFFVTACAFAPDYVFAFRAPGKPAVWWLLATGCWKAALVESGTDKEQWQAREQLLSPDAIARLRRCNAPEREPWHWPADPACLAEGG